MTSVNKEFYVFLSNNNNFVPGLIALRQLTRSDESGHFILVTDVKGKAIKYDANFWFFVQTLFQFKFPFTSTVLRLCKKCFVSDTWIVPNVFSAPIEMFIWLLFFSLLEQ